MTFKLTLLSFCILLTGCQPGTGEFGVTNENTQEPPVVEVDLLTQIQDTIFTPICTECHIGSQAPLGLRLENTDIAFEFLVNVVAIGNSAFDRVSPNEPDNSFLMLKIIGDPRAGQRMPLGRTPLSDESIQLVRDWIEQGALPAENSRVLTKVSSVKPTMPINNELSPFVGSIQYEVLFSQPIDPYSVSKNSLMVYQNYQDSAYLVSQGEYEITLINNRKINLTIANQQLDIESLSLVINDPSGGSILDLKGRILDGNNNHIEGGRYEFKFQVDRSN